MFKCLGKRQLCLNTHRHCVKNVIRQPLLQQERKGAQGWCMWEAGGGAGLHFWSCTVWKGVWGNSQKRLEKDEVGTRHGVQGGLVRHTEGTWGLGWGGGGGRNRSKQRHRMLQSSRTLLSWPPSSPAHGECSECDELIRSGLPLHLARSTGAGVLCPIPTYQRGFLGSGEVFNGHNSNGGSTWRM